MNIKKTLASIVLAGAMTFGLAGKTNANVFNMSDPNLTSIKMVNVGNPGNIGKLSGAGAGGYGPDRITGAVPYEYNIGKFEITTGQYTEFLNAVAKTDTYNLYNTYMWEDQPDYNYTNPASKIKRTGSNGNYTYTVADGYTNRPVNYVSWGDAARFVNWLTNGQPTGTQNLATTEDGSYYLNGAITNSNLLAINIPDENQRALWAIGSKRYFLIPSEDEWYKAAYHKNDGNTRNYWEYPTSSDTTYPNMANYQFPEGHTTDAGTYDYPSPYGSYDQGGNIWEWNETNLNGPDRALRGGSFDYPSVCLRAMDRDIGGVPTSESHNVGFRISSVPEPSTLGLLVLGGLSVLANRRKK